MTLALSHLTVTARSAGLALRGAFHSTPIDGVPNLPDGRLVQTMVLLGWIGGAQWPGFAASPENLDGEAHPLDRWSKRVIDKLAAAHGAVASYPFGGPPYLPFQRWAGKADTVFPSPLGLFIHPQFGLWHSYRGALGFAERLDLPERTQAQHPCESCATRPCLSTCPVGAFAPGHYDVDRCASHVKSPQGVECRTGGCLARRACPVGAERRYGTEQASFYMNAFIAAR